MGIRENPVATAVARAVQGNQRHLMGERDGRSRAKRRGISKKAQKARFCRENGVVGFPGGESLRLRGGANRSTQLERIAPVATTSGWWVVRIAPPAVSKRRVD